MPLLNATAPRPPDNPRSLHTALLLAATGGLLDAVVYMDHGHVFATAMTGNLVLLGISAVTKSWLQTVRHVAPLAGFVFGVTASKMTRSDLWDDSGIAGIGIEMVMLLVAGWLPHSFPEMAFTALIAFVCAYQVASFRRVGQFSYASTFITGNLLDAVEGAYDALTRRRTHRKAVAKTRDLGLICLCFLAGVVAGAFAAPRLQNHAFWLVEPLLLIVLISVVRRRNLLRVR